MGYPPLNEVIMWVLIAFFIALFYLVYNFSQKLYILFLILHIKINRIIDLIHANNYNYRCESGTLEHLLLFHKTIIIILSLVSKIIKKLIIAIYSSAFKNKKSWKTREQQYCAEIFYLLSVSNNFRNIKFKHKLIKFLTNLNLDIKPY